MNNAPMMNVFLRTATVLVLGLGLSSCFLTPSKLIYPVNEGAGFTDREPTEREKLIMHSDFSMEVVRVADARRARSTAMDAPDAILYEYEPNDLLQGINFRGPVLFNKYVATKARDPLKHYRVEVVIREMKTQILAGTLYTGRMGRYRIFLDTDILVRRPDSLVVVNRPYSIELVQARKSYNGRNPTAEMDRARTYDLLEDGVRKLAEHMAWDVRMTDARRWNPYAEVKKADKAAAHKAIREQNILRNEQIKLEKAGLSHDAAPYLVGEDGTPMMAPREQLVEPTEAPKPEDNVPLEPVMPENLGWGVGS